MLPVILAVELRMQSCECRAADAALLCIASACLQGSQLWGQRGRPVATVCHKCTNSLLSGVHQLRPSCRSTDGSICEIDLDFGPRAAQISLMRVLIPASSSVISSTYAPKSQLQYLKLTVSNDQTEWMEVAAGSDAPPYATGWSEINVNSTDSWRYARISTGRTSCLFSELQFVGILTPTAGPENCDVNVTVIADTGAVVSTASLSGAYSYSAAETPQITSVLPSYGTAAGGTLLTVTGV